ncbi:MAG: hypothetical protein Q8O61_10380 [Nocardioides sp.]|nr:hypothetical protein [Nocardioides sp.]
MTMTIRLPVVAVLVTSWFVSGCNSDERSMPSCVQTATIAFDGREYVAVDSLPGLQRREVRVGERLGTGERATCPGQPVRQVQVYKVVGVPVGQGVFSKPEFGLMERWNQDGTIK